MSLLSSIGKGILGGVTGFVTGGPVGAIAGAIGMGASGGGPKPYTTAPSGPMPIFNAPTPGNTGVTLGGGFNIPGLGGAAGGIAIGYTAGGSVAPGAGGACPRGFHLNKHALPASKRHGAVAARTLCVRNRHVNALNGRAAGRALRRLKRADKMTRKIHNLFHRAHHKAVRKR